MLFAVLTLAASLAVLASFAGAVDGWTAGAVATLALLVPSTLWIAAGAATAVVGVARPGAAPAVPHPGWRPRSRTAVLVTLCREDPVPVARYLDTLRRQLDRAGLQAATEIFVLSDTSGAAVAAERAALAALARAGAIRYRRRTTNAGRKPGNIADWFDAEAHRFDFMLVLDADSRMSAGRIARMIRRMEAQPETGLLQAGMSLVPARTRFGRVQRLAVRLLAPAFVQGFARWTGGAGNYWGHNALIRTAAFAAAVRLPRLPGRAPFGGDILSHDFVEAAWIRRAGWRVEVDPALDGSAEDGPATLAEFHRRDRRWCQGNLQHAGLIAAPGLHPLSRLHMASGIFGYLAAPVWLGLLLLMASGAVVVGSVLPFLLIGLLLIVPKLCGVWRLLRRRATPRRRAVVLRAAAAELVMSALLAPIVMVRQTGAVLSVLAGRDCGWKRPGPSRATLPEGVPEALCGLGLAGLAVATNPAATLWLAPVLLPLLSAPALVRRLAAPA